MRATVSDAISSEEPLRILVVEDELLIRHLAAEAIRDLGATAIEAATADEAWEYLRTGETVDVVFTDYRMPGSMTGGELASRVRDHYPDIPVVITSAWPGGSGWSGRILAKPYHLGETAKLLTELALERRRKRRPDAASAADGSAR